MICCSIGLQHAGMHVVSGWDARLMEVEVDPES